MKRENMLERSRKWRNNMGLRTKSFESLSGFADDRGSVANGPRNAPAKSQTGSWLALAL